tara:strand:- start:421 stop:1065 length:645 start_codon:yes stop_codon:yes gene_type:complete
MNIKLLIICYVPEFSKYMKNLTNNIENEFNLCAKKNNCSISVTKIYQRNRNLVLNSLKNLALYLNEPNSKAIIYYYGHGDQIRDRSGDEKDGKDEIWQTQGILDDEISKIFKDINNSSTLYLFSDSCSSGSMIDKKYNKKNWVTISSSNDRQDSLATSDGGVFTIWGLIPALKNLKSVTPKNIHDYIKKNIQIKSQTSLLHYNFDETINKKIFI